MTLYILYYALVIITSMQKIVLTSTSIMWIKSLTIGTWLPLYLCSIFLTKNWYVPNGSRLDVPVVLKKVIISPVAIYFSVVMRYLLCNL
jgi:hypothetical protein